MNRLSMETANETYYEKTFGRNENYFDYLSINIAIHGID